ncbi:hypothetical protein SAY86_016246 [Trapa natans]|uniref:Pentatricopeptide repeat-containing protein-mitochondrial domain-containing protein n=1 Tax=Trapa natans TaxID=22666 RepID=A0AAN7LDA9_TRANT|nr:hypothetical protein SAY86_016246 [Trapa natans]
MKLKFFCKKKWSPCSFRRIEGYRGKSSSRVQLPVLFGFVVSSPCTTGDTREFGNYSIPMAMNLKPGSRTVAGNLKQYKCISTLSGDHSLDHKKKRVSHVMQMEIVKALDKGERIRASDLLQRHIQMMHSSRADNFGLILKYCAQRTDTLFAMETWRSIDERKIKVKRTFCIPMIQTLCKGGYLEEALNMLHYLGENCGYYPMLDVYNYFLRASLKQKDVGYAGKCLDLMDQRLVGKNEHTYLELLKLAVLQKNWYAAHEIWEDYIKHYPANFPLMRYFVASYIELGDLNAAYEILQLMISYAFRGAAFGVKTIKGRFSFPKIDIPIPSKSELSLERWASGVVNDCSEEVNGLGCDIGSMSILSERNTMVHKSMSPIVDVLKITFNDLIHACALAHDCILAEKLFQQMQNIGLKAPEETYDGLIKAVIDSKGFPAGMEVLKMMQRKILKPRKATLATLSKACSTELELDLAEALVDQITRCPYPYPYNALLRACTLTNELERAVRVLAKMKQATAKPDIKTYELLFYLFGNVNHPYEQGNLLSQAVVAKRIKIIEADMAKNGIQHNSRSIRNLIRALGHEGMIKEVIRYLRLAEDLSCRNNMQLETPVYNTVLYALTAAEESRMALDMFKNMRKCGLSLNDVTYNIMIDCCSNIQCFRSATALVSLMIRDGFFPHVMTYTALIKVHCLSVAV